MIKLRPMAVAGTTHNDPMLEGGVGRADCWCFVKKYGFLGG
jgi:hypothetical protein